MVASGEAPIDPLAAATYTRAIMQRCKVCEASLTKEEKECLNCGTKVWEPPKSDFKTKGLAVIKWFFLFSVAWSALTLFTPWGGSFMTSISVTFVLLLVRSSWNEMLADRKE